MFVWPCIIHINNVEDQLDATITIYWYSNQLNMFRAIFLLVFTSARLCFTACGIMHPSCCRTVAWNAEILTVCSVWKMLLDASRATSWVHYTTSCNTQSSVPEDGQNNCPKHVELTAVINKPLLLHLVGCLYYLYQWCTVKQISGNGIYFCWLNI